LDGDAGALVCGCTFAGNGDDGIEIRLQERTHAIVQDCTFERNGEDGLEIIDSPLPKGIYNLLCVQNSSFHGNERYGVGFVRQKKPEVATEEMSKTAVYTAGNSFSGNGEAAISANYTPVFEAERSYPDTVRATIVTRGATKTSEFPVKTPVLVGMYDLRPTTDGTMVRDAEGVAVMGGEVAVADDSSRKIVFLDRRTGEVVREVPTAPFPGGNHESLGPEGLSLVSREGEEVLLLADDTGSGLWTLSLEASSFGEVLQHHGTDALGTVEGVETFGSRLVFARHPDVVEVDPASSNEVVKCPRVSFEGFGRHVAGIGRGLESGRVLVTVSGYTNRDQKWRNHKSAFFELDSDLSEVTGFWHLGAFSNDPRGIAMSGGLVYVADGRSAFEDANTGEMNRGGIKVLVFLPDRSSELTREALEVLPLRSDRTP
jgi:parallel beta helix pectate lyase-like protein